MSGPGPITRNQAQRRRRRLRQVHEPGRVHDQHRELEIAPASACARTPCRPHPAGGGRLPARRPCRSDRHDLPGRQRCLDLVKLRRGVVRPRPATAPTGRARRSPSKSLPRASGRAPSPPGRGRAISTTRAPRASQPRSSTGHDRLDRLEPARAGYGACPEQVEEPRPADRKTGPFLLGEIGRVGDDEVVIRPARSTGRAWYQSPWHNSPAPPPRPVSEPGW